MFKYFAFVVILCASFACSDSVLAQSYSPEALAGLKLFHMIIDLPANAARCGPLRRDLRDAFDNVLRPSRMKMVGLNRTADATIELAVSVNEVCDKSVHMSVLTTVTITKTGIIVSGLPIWDSGTIRFGQGTKFNGPGAVRFQAEQLLAAWNSANQ